MFSFKKFFTNLCLRQIDQLQKIFLDIYIKRDYPDKIFFYENKIYQQSRKILNTLYRFKRFLPVNELRALYDLAAAQGNLRFRVKDVTTFELIEKELKNPVKNFDVLMSIYESTLTIVSNEPVAFLLFIQALRDYEEQRKHVIA